MESLGARQQRQLYLLTYSRANLNTFFTRESFATAIVDAFEKPTVTKVLQWVVCLKRHKDDSDPERSHHYHMAIKLSKKENKMGKCSLFSRQGI